MQYEFINENCSEFSIAEMCECFGLSRSGYYDWAEREPSQRKLADATHKIRINELHKQARGRYGHRPIYHHLREEGIQCGRDRTLRLMKELGIEGIQKKGFKPLGTNSKHDFGYAPNMLKESNAPAQCDEIWVADTTYLRTGQSWCYLATVMDLYSRWIIGWSVSSKNDTDLVSQALRGAILLRGKESLSGLIHHSDRGSTYAAHKYEQLLRKFGITASMSAKGNCYDHASMESFYGRYKRASVRDRVFAGETEARANAFEYIEIFYNRFRKHASLGYQSPIDFEEKNCPPWGAQSQQA